jgi:hypothetical protein
MTTQVLARDSQKTGVKAPPKNQLFSILYDFILYVVVPIAFEMSFVKIFYRSLEAYQVNDVIAMGRLIAYFAIQWLLGVLVRKNYINTSLKKVTLALLILIQVKEVFFEDVFFDMMLSIILESGFTWLLFLKFAQLMVVLKLMGFGLIIFAAGYHARKYSPIRKLKVYFKNFTVQADHYVHRMQYCMRMKIWHRKAECQAFTCWLG